MPMNEGVFIFPRWRANPGYFGYFHLVFSHFTAELEQLSPINKGYQATIKVEPQTSIDY